MQQRLHGLRLQRLRASERPQIARDLAAMLTGIEAIVSSSSNEEIAGMAALVQTGGRPAGAALLTPFRSERAAT
jgi:hypothetical protein